MPLIELRLSPRRSARSAPGGRWRARPAGRRSAAGSCPRCRSRDSVTGSGWATARGTDGTRAGARGRARRGTRARRRRRGARGAADPLALGAGVGLGVSVGLAEAVAVADAEVDGLTTARVAAWASARASARRRSAGDQDVRSPLCARRDRRVARSWSSRTASPVGLGVPFFEVDLPHRAAGVVDGELDADLARRDGRQEDEDEARDGDESAERGRTSGDGRSGQTRAPAGRARRAGAVVTNSSSCTPKSRAWRAQAGARPSAGRCG